MDYPWTPAGLPGMADWIDEDHFLDSFVFAARTIDEWTRIYGKKDAEDMILSNDWQEPYASSFATAFGE